MTRAAETMWQAFESSGANSLVRRSRRSRLLIVCYHGICQDDCPERDWLLVRRGTFIRQLDFLSDRFRILPLDEAVAQLGAGSLKEPTAAITFDDGYRNNHAVAWPELRARRLPFTVFLATGLVSTSETLWTTTLRCAIRASYARELDLEDWGGPRFSLDSPIGRERAASVASDWLKDIPAHRRSEIVPALLARLGPVSPPPQDYAFMTWDEVRELAGTSLVRFGAHTVHHEILSRLDDASLAREITESVGTVEALGIRASRVFAYPNGRAVDFDRRSVRVLESLGLLGAVTTIPGTNTHATPRHALRRLVVDERMSLARFASEAGGLGAVLAEARTWSRRSAGRSGENHDP